MIHYSASQVLRRLLVSILFAVGAFATANIGGSPVLATSHPTSTTIGETSGFVDENGNPISLEDYEKIREEQTGVQWDNIAVVVVAIAVIGSGIVIFVRRRKN